MGMRLRFFDSGEAYSGQTYSFTCDLMIEGMLVLMAVSV